MRVISDTQTNIQNTNDYGMLRNYKRWYSVNRNMHYNEKEEGNKIKEDLILPPMRLRLANLQLMALLVWVICGSLTFSAALVGMSRMF